MILSIISIMVISSSTSLLLSTSLLTNILGK